MSEFEISHDSKVYMKNDETGEMEESRLFQGNLGCTREALPEGGFLYTVFNKMTGEKIHQEVRDE